MRKKIYIFSISLELHHFVATTTMNTNNTIMNNGNTANAAMIMTPQLSTQTTMYPYASTTTNNQDGQVLGTLLLSPIKEMDSSSSNNTLIPGHPQTAALAQAVLPANLANSE